ncbi:MAG: hypothetical protein Q4F67_01935 [Propionibacteriaceae bacterium]|nr:hypothetical protein [Propionibacteriaceae bacterium]
MTDQVPGQRRSDHVSVDVLADAAENLLSPEQVTLVNDHLHQCPECAEIAQALTDACEALRELPAPPMPEAVLQRLTALVRAESERRANGEADAEVEAGIADAAKRTDLGTFRQNPLTKKGIDIRHTLGRTPHQRPS